VLKCELLSAEGRGKRILPSAQGRPTACTNRWANGLAIKAQVRNAGVHGGMGPLAKTGLLGTYLAFHAPTFYFSAQRSKEADDDRNRTVGRTGAKGKRARMPLPQALWSDCRRKIGGAASRKAPHTTHICRPG